MPGSFLCGQGSEGRGTGGRAWWWCVRGDWCGLFCVGLVWASTLFVDYCTTKFTLVPHFDLTRGGQLSLAQAAALELYGGGSTNNSWGWGWAHVVGFQVLVGVIFWCHFTAGWADPGLVAKDEALRDLFRAAMDEAQKQDDPAAVRKVKKAYCVKCEIPKPAGTHHCSSCGRCVRHMDHHCPWINNCAAERTLKPFCLFLVYVFLGTSYAMIMMCLRGYRMIMNPAYAQRNRITLSTKLADQPRFLGVGFVETPVAQLIMSMLAFILALFFCIFVIVMMYDQWEAATTGTPGVDAMQGHFHLPEGETMPLMQGLREHVFREGFSWRWFVPWIPDVGRPAVPLPPPPSPPPPPPPPPPPAASQSVVITAAASMEVHVHSLVQDHHTSSYRSEDAFTDEEFSGKEEEGSEEEDDGDMVRKKVQ